MTLFEIYFTDGTSVIEYGDSRQDVEDFCKRVWPNKIIETIVC